MASDAACASLQLSSTSPRTNASMCERSSACPSRFLRMISCASISLFAVGDPDVLDVCCRSQELAPLALARIQPVALLPRGPGALHVGGRGGLHRLHALAAAEIPHRFH